MEVLEPITDENEFVNNYKSSDEKSNDLKEITESTTAQKFSTTVTRISYSQYNPDIQSIDIDIKKLDLVKFRQMKEQFPEETDERIARFLLGKNNDYKMASSVLSNHIEWRKGRFPISKQSCLNEFKKGKIFVYGTDKAGHPLVHLTTRFNDPKIRDIDEVGLCLYWWVQYIEFHYSNRIINNDNKNNITNIDDNIKNTLTTTSTPNDSTKISTTITNNMINSNNENDSNNQKVTRFTVLFNRHGADINNVDIEVMKIFSTILQVNYPETLSTAIIHPVNWIFYSVFNIAKFFVDVNTREKIHPVIHIDGVKEFIDDKYIPIELGGTCTYQFNPDDYEDPF